MAAVVHVGTLWTIFANYVIAPLPAIIVIVIVAVNHVLTIATAAISADHGNARSNGNQYPNVQAHPIEESTREHAM